MDIVERSFSRDKAKGDPDKIFPDHAHLRVTLGFSAADMDRVRTWYKNTRFELGDNFVADFDVPRLIYEALAGGAVNPFIVKAELVEPESPEVSVA